MAIEASLSDQVADEIRAMLGRKRTSGRELARRLNVSQAWISYRLTGAQEIGLNDLQRIAEALEVSISDLLPASSQLSDTRHQTRGAAGESKRGYLPAPARRHTATISAVCTRPADGSESDNPRTIRPRRLFTHVTDGAG